MNVAIKLLEFVFIFRGEIVTAGNSTDDCQALKGVMVFDFGGVFLYAVGHSA